MPTISREVVKDALHPHDDEPLEPIAVLVEATATLRLSDLLDLRTFLDRLEDLAW